MKKLAVLVGLALFVSVHSTQADTLSFIAGSDPGTQPAINDNGEIIWTSNGQIISNQRGVVVSGGVDASNIGISNSGEIVYASGLSDSAVTSTTRGVLVTDRSYGPTIAATTGEVAYVKVDVTGVSAVFTTIQGLVASASSLTRVGVADVNDKGEVVYEYRLLSQQNTQIFSSIRGFLTPITINAIQPSINDLGEVVWSQTDVASPDGKLHQAIFSSLRGQLTGGNGFEADLPDIANDGTIVFRGGFNPGGLGPTGIYELSPGPVSAVPGPIAGAGLPGLVFASVGLLAWRRRKLKHAAALAA